METDFYRRYRPDRISLNRTMQYGNYFCFFFFFSLCGSLNRTMQYGNVLLFVLFFALPSEFKSYYVVWKPANPNMSFQEIVAFKSYYVVWKPRKAACVQQDFFRLNRTMQYGNHLYYDNTPKYHQFKSYYVVWKPLSLQLLVYANKSLNRTMQYGNVIPNMGRGQVV